VRELGHEAEEVAHRVPAGELAQAHLALGEERAALGPQQERRLSAGPCRNLLRAHHPYHGRLAHVCRLFRCRGLRQPRLPGTRAAAH
jgi:hypothetical protein